MAVVQTLDSVAMSSTYDSHSSVQVGAGQRHLQPLLAALAHVNPLSSFITVLDCGSATGLNSMKALRPALQMFRETSQTPIQVHHCDLPDNPWSVLFSNALVSPHSYMSVPNTYVAGIGRSYHGRVMPANSVSLVYSSHSLHWLSVRSQVRGQLKRYVEEDPEFHAELRALSDADMNNFLGNRAEEMMVGGRMVLQVTGSMLPDMPRYQVLQRMQSEGLISAEPLQRYSVFTYPATPDSIRSILSRHPTLSLLSLSELNITDAVYRQYQQTGDHDTYSQQYVEVMKAATGAMMLDLFKAEGEACSLVSTFFEYTQEIVKVQPLPLFTKELDIVIQKSSYFSDSESCIRYRPYL